MIRSRTALLALAVSTAVALAACKKPEEAVPPAPSPAVTAPSTPAPMAPAAATAAASVTSVDLGNAVGADNRVAAPATTFAPTDTIYAAVATRTSEPAGSVPGTLSAKWTYQDGQTVHEDSRQLTLSGDGTTVFQVSKPDGFPAGKYKVEIAWDGTVAQTREFEVK